MCICIDILRYLYSHTRIHDRVKGGEKLYYVKKDENQGVSLLFVCCLIKMSSDIH